MLGKFKCVGVSNLIDHEKIALFIFFISQYNITMCLNLFEELNILPTRSLMASNLIQCEQNV